MVTYSQQKTRQEREVVAVMTEVDPPLQNNTDVDGGDFSRWNYRKYGLDLGSEEPCNSFRLTGGFIVLLWERL